MSVTLVPFAESLDSNRAVQKQIAVTVVDTVLVWVGIVENMYHVIIAFIGILTLHALEIACQNAQWANTDLIATRVNCHVQQVLIVQDP